MLVAVEHRLNQTKLFCESHLRDVRNSDRRALAEKEVNIHPFVFCALSWLVSLAILLACSRWPAALEWFVFPGNRLLETYLSGLRIVLLPLICLFPLSLPNPSRAKVYRSC